MYQFTKYLYYFGTPESGMASDFNSPTLATMLAFCATKSLRPTPYLRPPVKQPLKEAYIKACQEVSSAEEAFREESGKALHVEIVGSSQVERYVETYKSIG